MIFTKLSPSGLEISTLSRVMSAPVLLVMVVDKFLEGDPESVTVLFVIKPHEGAGVFVGVGVFVLVAVGVGVLVGVEEGVNVGVAVSVGVKVGVAVSVGVGVAVFVDVGVGVLLGVKVGPPGVMVGVLVGVLVGSLRWSPCRGSGGRTGCSSTATATACCRFFRIGGDRCKSFTWKNKQGRS